MTALTGVGWIARGGYGAQRRGLEGSFQNSSLLRDELLDRGIVPYPIKRFGKFDDVCRMSCLVAALSLYDAGVECTADDSRDIAVLGTNEKGCLQTNRDFYQDFVEHGRKGGRGSLFVYTLPSMPASEVSMHFKLVGPTAWFGSVEAPCRALLERADAMLRRRDTEAVLCLDVSESGGLGFFLERADDGGGAVADLSTVLRWAGLYPTPDQMLDALRGSFKGARHP
jgi:hypothetical protein